VRSAFLKLALLVLVVAAVTGVGATPGCGGGYDDPCYCELVYDPICACYVETCYHCKTAAEKLEAMPEPPEGYHLETRGDVIVAVPDEGM
jgi:hypothetical protein